MAKDQRSKVPQALTAEDLDAVKGGTIVQSPTLVDATDKLQGTEGLLDQRGKLNQLNTNQAGRS